MRLPDPDEFHAYVDKVIAEGRIPQLPVPTIPKQCEPHPVTHDDEGNDQC